ncbi:MAG: single-stranded DNA-binding protein [Elusimicrobia bacterium]|nr:single-stranded DNA-binding protein [Elusimicrobiota bacterium]
MSAGVRLPEQNQVMLTGRLTRDPEFMSTQSGVAKCWFSLAVNRRYRDKVSGEWKDDTAFIPVVVWREAAQRCKEKLKKGGPVHIEGRLRSRKFEDKASGAQRTVVEVEARRVQFLAAAESGAEAPAAAHPGEGEASAGETEIEEAPF